MSKRSAISVKTKVDVAIMQANLYGMMLGSGGFICPLCRERMAADDERVLEHSPPRALLVARGVKNPDDPGYLAWVHKRCADLKTRGCEGTSKKGSVANGDTHRIRKATRIADGGKKVRRPMPKVHRPMQSHANPWGKR